MRRYEDFPMTVFTIPLVHILPLWVGAAVLTTDAEPQVSESDVHAEDERREALFANVWAVAPPAITD